MIPEARFVADIFEAMRQMGGGDDGESALFQDFDDGIAQGIGAAMNSMRDGFRDTAEQVVEDARQQAGEMTEKVVAAFSAPRENDTIAPHRSAFDRKYF